MLSNEITGRYDFFEKFDPRVAPGWNAPKGSTWRYVPAVGSAVLLQKQDNGLSTNWTDVGTSGGNTIQVNDEGVSVITAATTLNFVGAGVTASNAGAGVANITIPGGGASVGTASALSYYASPGGALTSFEDGVATTTSVLDPAIRKLSFLLGASTVDATALSGSLAFLQTVTIGATGAPNSVFSGRNLTVGIGTGSLWGQFTSDSATGILLNDTNGPLMGFARVSTATLTNRFTNTANTFARLLMAARSDGDGLIQTEISEGVLLGRANSASSILAQTSAQSVLVGRSDNASSEIRMTAAVNAVMFARAATAGIVRATASNIFIRGSASNSGVLEATATNAYVFGFADGAGTIIQSTGNTAFIMARAAAGAVITNPGPGSMIVAFATGAASTLTNAAGGQGSLIHGVSDAGGAITNTFIGGLVGGYATGAASIIRALGNGAYARGSAEAGGLIECLNTAAFAHGRANGGSSVLRGTAGSASFGEALSGSTIESTFPGSFVHGEASVTSVIGTYALGAFAGGFANTSASITSNGNGSFSHGSASGASSVISSTGAGSFASGSAVNGFDLIASGQASIVFGFSESGNIESTQAGAFTHGDDSVNGSKFGFSSGLGHTNASYLQAMFGRYESTFAGSAAAWVSTEPLFVIGNGASSVSRSNAFRVDKDARQYNFASRVHTGTKFAVGATAINARTDYHVLCDLSDMTGGALTLPPGEDGLMFVFAPISAGAATYTITPNGANVLDAQVVAIIATGVRPVKIIFNTNTWYQIS